MSRLEESVSQVVDDAAHGLENAWRAGGDVELRDFVPPPDHPARRSALAALIKIDQEHRWQSTGKNQVFRKKVEHYLQDWPDLRADHDSIKQLVHAECLTRADQGELLGLDKLAAELRGRFPKVPGLPEWVIRRLRGGSAVLVPEDQPAQDQSVSLTSAQNVDHICQEFEDAWLRGERPDLVEYLKRSANASPQARKSLLKELLKAELEFRVKAGEQPRIQDYLPRFAKVEPLVREVLAEVLGRHADPPQQKPVRTGAADSKTSALDETPHWVKPAPPGRNPTTPDGKLTLPCQFGPYELINELGAGGMGIVYRAWHRLANKVVALKLIRPDQLSHFLPQERADVLARFRREIEAAARLDHDHVVTVYDVGEIDGQAYYTMRYVDGASLKEKLDKGPLEPREAARYAQHVALALVEAHKAGILHRDLKPHNIMLDRRTDRALLADFGLAKLAGADQQLTATTAVMGSPPYMSPEQTKDAGKVNELSDVYGLGATLYHLLTGRPPFQAANATATMIQVQTEEPVSPSLLNPVIPQDLETIALKCLEKELIKRYRSAQALADDLGRFLRGEPVRARPVGRIERAWRWSKRNPVIAGLMGAILLVLMLGSIVSSVFGVHAEQQRQLAEQEKDRAEQEQKLAEQERKRAETQRLEAERQKKLAEENLAVATVERQRTATEKHHAETQRQEAERQKRLAEQNLAVATAERQRSATETQRAQTEAEKARAQALRAQMAEYITKIQGAQQALENHELGLAESILVGCAGDLRGWEHKYLWIQLQRGMKTLKGHATWVNSVAISPDGRRIVSGSDDMTLKLWDATTGQEVMTLKGHTDRVWSVAFSPDSRRISSGSADKTLKVWNTNTGREVMTLEGHTSAVTSVAFSPDGRRIVSGSDDNTIKLWNATTGREIMTLKAGTSQVRSVAFSPDSRRIVSGLNDSTLKVWDVAARREVMTLEGHTAHVYSVAFSPDGQRIVSGSMDKTLKVWDAGTGREVMTLKGHTAHVYSVAFSPDGQRIVSGSWDNTVKVWNSGTGQEILSLTGHRSVVTGVAFFPDGRQIVSGSRDYTLNLKLWDANTDQEVMTLKEHAGPVTSVAFSPDARHIVSGSRDTTLKLWNVATGQEVMTLKGHSSPVVSVAFSPDGRRIVSGGGGDLNPGEIKVWDAATGKEVLTLKGHTDVVNSVAFSRDGRRIVSGGGGRDIREPGEVNLWDASTGKEVLTRQGHSSRVTSVAFSPDGRRLVSGSGDKTLKVWDVVTGQETITLTGPASSVSSVAFSPDGRRIVSGIGDGTLKVFDAATGQDVATLKGHTSSVTSVAFSPDGRRIVSGSYDNTLKLWNPAAAREVMTLKGRTGSLNSVAFSPDGRRIVSGSQDGTLKVWDAGPPAPLPGDAKQNP